MNNEKAAKGSRYNMVAVPESFWIDANKAAHWVGFIVAEIDGRPFANTATDYLTM